MPIDFESRFRNPGKDFESRFRPTGPGATPDNPLNEQGVDELERFTVNTVAPDMRSAAAWLKNRGYEAVPMADENNVAVRKGGGPWKKLEPSGFWNSIFTGDFVKDLTSDAFDEHAEGAAMAGGAFGAGLLASPTGPGAVAAGMAGAGAGAAAARTARHAAGVAAGFEDDLGSAATDIALSGAMGAAGEGLGRAIGYGGKKLLSAWRGKTPQAKLLDADQLAALKAGDRQRANLGELDDIARELAEEGGGQAYPPHLELGPVLVKGRPASDKLRAWQRTTETLEQGKADWKGKNDWYTERVRPAASQPRATKPLDEKLTAKLFKMSDRELRDHLNGKGENFVRQVAEAAGIEDEWMHVDGIVNEMLKRPEKIISALGDKRFAGTRLLHQAAKAEGHGAVGEAVFREATDDQLRRLVFAVRPPSWAGTMDSAVVREWLGSGSLRSSRELILDVWVDHLKRKAPRSLPKGRRWWETLSRDRQLNRKVNIGTRKNREMVRINEMTLDEMVRAFRKMQPLPNWFSGLGYNPKRHGVMPVWDIEAQAFRNLNLDSLLGVRFGERAWTDFRKMDAGGIARGVGRAARGLGRAMQWPGNQLGARSQITRELLTAPGRIVETIGDALFRDGGSKISSLLRGPMPTAYAKDLRGLQRTLNSRGPRAARAALFVLLKENQELGDYLQQMELEPPE